MQPREALFLSLMVTNCSGERSFTIFKRRNELKMISTIPCNWTLLRRRQQQAEWSWDTPVMI